MRLAIADIHSFPILANMLSGNSYTSSCKMKRVMFAKANGYCAAGGKC